MRRAISDFNRILHSGRFWLVETLLSIAAPVFAIFFLTPDGASPAREVSTGAIAVAIAICGGLLTAFLASLYLAPYRQRNEALKRISELETPKLFDVVCQTTSLGLPINRLDNGTYQASAAVVGFAPILFAHRGDLTNVTRLIASPEIRFTNADNLGWETTNSIQLAPLPNMMAGPQAMDFSWDTGNTLQWVLTGLPLTMAKGELLQLPMMGVSVPDGNEAGAHFEKDETCTLTIRLAIRTDKGSPALPDQVITLSRSDIRDTEIWQRIQREAADEPKP